MGELWQNGGHGIGEGGDGQHQPVFHGGAGAAWDYGEYGEPWNVGAGVMRQTPQEFQDAVKGWVESGWTPWTAGDIADACALLCSDEARFVTGHGISVDGGSSLMNPDFPLALQVPR